MTSGGERSEWHETRGSPPRPRVALFITCLADLFFPRIALAAAKVLRHLGVEPESAE